MARDYPDQATWSIAALASEYVRAPTNVYMEAGVGVWEFDPVLTAQEQATFDDIKALVLSQRALTPIEYGALRAEFNAFRNIRNTFTRNQWVALSEGDFRRALYDWIIATTKIGLADHRET